MHAANGKVTRRDFIRRSAEATAAVAAAALGVDAVRGATSEGRTPEPPHGMPARVLGRTGVKLPVLGFGGAALPRKWGNPLSTAERVKLVRHAWERGIRYFDTASSATYADSQAIIGRALKDVRESVFITTKVDFWNPARPDGRITRVDRSAVARQIEKNLEELQSDYIDAIMVHGTPGVEQMTIRQCMEVHAELARARNQGLVRFVGFSAHHYFDKALALIDTGAFDLCMLAYGYLPRGHSRLFSPRTIALRDACLARAHERKMGIVAMKVLGAGMLGGFGRKDLAGVPGAAVRYVLQDDRVHVLVVGMRYPAEIDANVGTVAGDTTFTDRDRALLARAAATVLGSKSARKMRVE